MGKHLGTYLLLSLICITNIPSLSISPQNANEIGKKIWKNECGGSIEGLTNWKKGENFPSLGIGHFIWYPLGKKERFQETFPILLLFLEKKGATIPSWLKKSKGCPWNSREEFYENIQSSDMQSLRQLLLETQNLQAIFIANRLETSIIKILDSCSKKEKKQIETTFYLLANNAQGLYALIDYLNFKGEGTSPSETYKGQGWGLLQVLKNIPSPSFDPVFDFVKAAKDLLTQRVANSPPERNEKQWLKGWFNRLDTYTNK